MKKKNEDFYKLIVKRPDGDPVNEYFGTAKERDKKAAFYKTQKIKTKKG